MDAFVETLWPIVRVKNFPSENRGGLVVPVWAGLYVMVLFSETRKFVPNYLCNQIILSHFIRLIVTYAHVTETREGSDRVGHCYSKLFIENMHT